MDRTHIDLASTSRHDSKGERDTSGWMALLPDPKSTEHLLVDDAKGTPRDELHLTVVFMGGDVTDWTARKRHQVLTDARALAGRTAPVTGTVMSHSVFNPNGDGGREPAAVYLVSTDQVTPLVDAVKKYNGSDFPYFFPHVTAGYGLNPTRMSYTGPVRFDRLLIALGDEQTIIPLAGGPDA